MVASATRSCEKDNIYSRRSQKLAPGLPYLVPDTAMREQIESEIRDQIKLHFEEVLARKKEEGIFWEQPEWEIKPLEASRNLVRSSVLYNVPGSHW